MEKLGMDEALRQNSLPTDIESIKKAVDALRNHHFTQEKLFVLFDAIDDLTA